jgi:hypothetical protein
MPCVFPQWFVYKVISDLLEATLHVKGEWRSATTMLGAPSVMIGLELLMHVLPADN